MAHLICRHQVKDYDAWREVYDSVQGLRSDKGEVSDIVYRDDADGTQVTLVQEWKSLDHARAFMDDPGLKDAMAKAGVVGAPTFHFVEKA